MSAECVCISPTFRGREGEDILTYLSFREPHSVFSFGDDIVFYIYHYIFFYLLLIAFVTSTFFSSRFVSSLTRVLFLDEDVGPQSLFSFFVRKQHRSYATGTWPVRQLGWGKKNPGFHWKCH